MVLPLYVYDIKNQDIVGRNPVIRVSVVQTWIARDQSDHEVVPCGTSRGPHINGLEKQHPVVLKTTRG